MTTTTQATRSAAATGYTLRIINKNTWRIYDQKKTKNATQEHLDHYYFHENASSTANTDAGENRMKLQKSLPYHHCLMKASHSSSQTVLDAQCLYPYFRTKQKMHIKPYTTTVYIDSTCALARIHEHEHSKTPYTELTAFQKAHLIAQSAITGLLVSRLFGISSAMPWTIQFSKKHADLTTKYIHSALASEYLIGRRYYYNLSTVLSQEFWSTGNDTPAPKLKDITVENATFEKVQESRARLIELYNSNIARLEYEIKQFSRGFLSLQNIRKDPEYKKLFEIFWLLQTQCMKYRQVVELDSVARQILCQKNSIAYDRKSINILTCNLVFSCQAVCPKLFSYDIVHLFDNCIGSYARYVKTTKSKQLELCSQGLVSGLLAFAAIEPNLVSAYVAPHIESFPFDLSTYAFHIPSRDTIFGPLVSKHRIHIPRPAVIGRTTFMTKNNRNYFYLPIQDTLTELQTGKKSAKNSWKKNKENFK